MLLQSVYAIVDLAYVGRLGSESVAGLAVSFQVFFIVLAVAQVISTTALSNVSQAYGRDDVAGARTFFSSYMAIATVVGIVAAAVALASANTYVTTFTEDPGVMVEALAYFKVNTLTFLTQMLLIAFGFNFRGSGDFITPVKVMVASVLTNVILDPILIFGPGPLPAMGIAGAAWATVIGQTVGIVAYAVSLARQRDPRALRCVKPVITWHLIKDIAVRGGPAGIQFLMLSALMGVILGAMKSHGAIWTATAGGGFRVLQQTILPIVALSSAAAAISGQNLGAGKIERIREASITAMRWALIYGTIMCFALFFGARLWARLFAEPHELDVVQLYFHWSAPTTIAFALAFVPTFVLQALGKAILPMAAGVLRILFLIIVVFGVIVPRGMEPQWVFGAAMLSAFVEGIPGVWLLFASIRGLQRKKDQEASVAAE